MVFWNLISYKTMCVIARRYYRERKSVTGDLMKCHAPYKNVPQRKQTYYYKLIVVEMNVTIYF